MRTKPYHILENEQAAVAEPAVAYLRRDEISTCSSTGSWGPNALFDGTQEEFLEHIHCIEEGDFFPVKEVHNRISQWIYNQKK